MVDGKKKTKKRVRNFTPADRAAHRVFEKSRREAFNDQLMVSIYIYSGAYVSLVFIR